MYANVFKKEKKVVSPVQKQEPKTYDQVLGIHGFSTKPQNASVKPTQGWAADLGGGEVMYAKALKANPYHGKDGRFTSKDKATATEIADLKAQVSAYNSILGVPSVSMADKKLIQTRQREALFRLDALGRR